MCPPGDFKASKIALFCTSKTPFSSEWIEKFCKETLDPPFEGIPDDAELVLIEGDFVGWTPLQVARRYVVPNFVSEDSPFTSLSFAIADDNSHEDGQVLVPAIDWEYFNKPDYPLRIEGTCRAKPDETFISVFLLQDGIKGIYNFDSEDYDNKTDPGYVAERRAWLEAGGTIDSPKPLIEDLPVYKYYIHNDDRLVSVHQSDVDDPTKDWWLKEPKSEDVREISDEDMRQITKAAVDKREAERARREAEDVRRYIEGTYVFPEDSAYKLPVGAKQYLLSNGHVLAGGAQYEPGTVIDDAPERVEVVREISPREIHERWLAAAAARATQPPAQE